MSVSNTIGLLQTLHKTITGIGASSAPTTYPNAKLDPSLFPYVLVMPGEATWHTLAGTTEQTRIYECWLFLYEKKPDYYVNARTAANTYLQRFGEAYTSPANKTLANPPNYVEIQSHRVDGVRDSGLAELEYLDNLYYGIRFLVSIYEYDNS